MKASRALLVLLGALGACAGADIVPPTAPALVPVAAGNGEAPDEPDPPAHDAALATADVGPSAVDAPSEPAPHGTSASDEVWLRGSTHVHARPSGDSSEPISAVIKWYEDRHYDFIALTDHNKVSELGPDHDTVGQVAITSPTTKGLIVLSGVELTHNPSGCLPPGDKSKKCRIHVNAFGATARPGKKLDWANRKTHDRIEKYQAAIDQAKALGAQVIQINHPQWYWGMTSPILTELSKRGVRLVEIANIQFTKWNLGDPDHPSMEQLWDGALVAGATLWGVSSDDAHSYHANKHDQWPAGGGWIVVHARRDPQAILDAMAAGHFYASTGVELVHAETSNEELVVEVASAESGKHKIAFIENGKLVETVEARAAKRALPATGYVRAVVTRDDGSQAWVQPARR